MISLDNYSELNKMTGLPSMKDCFSDKPIKNKSIVLEYMKSQPVSLYAFMHIRDVVTGKIVPETVACQDDGVYEWRNDVVYHFEHYNLALPDDFIKHVLTVIRKSA